MKKLPLLDKWPPPSAYKDEENWLAFTQADGEFNSLMQSHCAWKRQQLRSTVSRKVLDDFKNSDDPVDRKLYELRAEESKTYRKCEERTEA